jgi:peptidyl-prolyl cis-trans isomerase SurA
MMWIPGRGRHRSGVRCLTQIRLFEPKAAMSVRRHTRLVLALASSAALALTCVEAMGAGKKATPKESGTTTRGEQAIVLLINDEPITAWEIEQRSNFLSTSTRPQGDFRAKAEARWKQIIADPKTNERFQALIKEKNVKSQQEAQAVQAGFVKQLQQNMIEQLKRESRAAVLPGLRKQAEDELIEERLKLQEGKKLGIELNDDDLKGMLKNLADNNKLTVDQFIAQTRSMGFDVSTLQSRMRAQVVWREVIRRKYGAQISPNQRDIDRAMMNSASEGLDTVELQVQKISLPVASLNQSVMARRYAEADALRSKFAGCKSMPDLARGIGDARFDDLKFIRPATMAEPTRSMLLSAKDGDMLPPVAGTAGIEVYAVCSRRAIKDEKQQQKAAEDIQQREFEMHARRHLLDLKQDAHIERR